MKKLYLALFFITILAFAKAQVGINILIPDSSAVLQLESSSKGLGLPRLTSTERDSITAPLKGLTIFNTVDSNIEYWTGECWLKAWQQHCWDCDFTMSITPTTDTLDRTISDTVTATITAQHLNGTQPISLIYLASVPQGINLSFTGNATIDTSGSVQLIVEADQCAPVGGNFNIIVEGFCGDQIHFVTLNVYIRPPLQYTIPADVYDYNLATVNNLPPSPAQYVLLNINSGVNLHASVSTNPAYNTGNLDVSSLVCINNDGDILGRGGDGAAFTIPSGGGFNVGGDPGNPGGIGMNLTTRTVLQNTGAVYGGGSGGGSIGLVVGTPNIPIIGPIDIGVGFAGGGGSELGAGGIINANGINIGIFKNGTAATCCVGSVPGLGGTETYPINIPISIATIEITPSGGGGNGGGFGQQGQPGWVNVSITVCVDIPIIGNICIPIPIPGGFLPYYGQASGPPGNAIKRNNNPLTGLADGTYNGSQVKGVVGP